jgi:hypothetical protein
MSLCIVCILTTVFYSTPWISIPQLFSIPVHKIHFNTRSYPPYSYFISTNCNSSLLNYTKIDHALLFPISILSPLMQNELVYTKDTILWYKHNEKQINIWNIPSQSWYTSDDYPYRSI